MLKPNQKCVTYINRLYRIANTMLYGLFILAQSLAFTPAFNAALLSATRMYEMIDRRPLIQSPNISQNGNIYNKTNAVDQGVSFRGINFAYPTRADHSVLQDFNLDVLQGQTIALVGASGSGKSTCVQLLLRYYDPNEGKIVSYPFSYKRKNITNQVTIYS